MDQEHTSVIPFNFAYFAQEFKIVGNDQGDGYRADNVTSIGGWPCVGGRSEGVIKEFKNEKGIITPTDGTDDLPFSAEDMWRVFGTPQKGDKVMYDPMEHATLGWIAVYIETQYLCGKCGQHGHVREECKIGRGRLIGIVQSWDYEQGFGFIAYLKPIKNTIARIECFYNNIKLEHPHKSPKVGSKVKFTLEWRNRIKVPTNITGIDGGYCEVGRHTGTITSVPVKTEAGIITPTDGSADLSYLIKNQWDESEIFKVGDVVDYDPQVGWRPTSRKTKNKKLKAFYITKKGQDIDSYERDQIDQ